MSRQRQVAWAVALWMLSTPLYADLQRAMSEPNLEKRSQLALDNAAAAYKNARAAYDKGDLEAVSAAIKEVQESVDLAHASLTKTGKDPRKNPKWFKKAEITTRDLLRRLESFQQEMSFSDRPLLDACKTRVTQVHDELLVGLMEGQRK
jgi:RNA polymerase-interacting CarD/CdnL/TRCF family regulator